MGLITSPAHLQATQVDAIRRSTEAADVDARAYAVTVEVIRLIRQGKPLEAALRGSSVLRSEKLTAEDVAAIRASAAPASEAAALYAVTWQTIRNIRQGTWHAAERR